MKPTNRLLMVALMAANKANAEKLNETIRRFEVAGLMDHTYIEDKKENVVIEYNFTPMFRALIEGI